MIVGVYALQQTHICFTQTVAIELILQKFKQNYNDNDKNINNNVGQRNFCSSNRDLLFCSELLVYLRLFSAHCAHSEKTVIITFLMHVCAFKATLISTEYPCPLGDIFVKLI